MTISLLAKHGQTVCLCGRRRSQSSGATSREWVSVSLSAKRKHESTREEMRRRPQSSTSSDVMFLLDTRALSDTCEEERERKAETQSAKIKGSRGERHEVSDLAAGNVFPSF